MKRIPTLLLVAGMLTGVSHATEAASITVGNFTGGTAVLHAPGTIANGSGAGLNVMLGAVLLTGDLGTFESYCVDLQHYDTPGLNVSALDTMNNWNNGATSTAVPVAPKDPLAGGEASYLYNKYAAGAVGNQLLEAALSLAIWDALYDSDFNVLGGTGFWVTSVSLGTAVTDAANKMLGDLNAYEIKYGTTSLPYDTWIRTNNSANNLYSQDFIAPVPEPAMLILLGTGMAGAFGFRRRLARKRSAAN